MAESASLHDDPGIPDGEPLYRTVHPNHVHPTEDRPSSAAFKKLEISVDRSSLSSPQESLDRHPNHTCVAEVSAGEARTVENVGGVVSDPIAGDPEMPDNPAHALIFREDGTSKSAWFTVTAKALARAASWALVTHR